MKRSVLLISILFISIFTKELRAQIIGSNTFNIRELYGIVTADSTMGAYLSNAHVFIIKKNDTIPLVTNHYGSFSYKGQILDSMRIRVTALGYKTFEGDFLLKKHGTSIRIVMQQESVQLNEIIIKGKTIAMVLKGDTLQYNSDAFLTLDGDFMDILLKKIPGIELNNNQITVNGEAITKIYVNGNDKIFQDTEETIKNIEASNVKNIKVYDEMNKEDKKMGFKYGRKEKVMDVTTKRKIDYQKIYTNSISIGNGFNIANLHTNKYQHLYDMKLSYSHRDMQSNRSIIAKGYYSNVYPVYSIDLKGYGGTLAYRKTWKSGSSLNINTEYKNDDIYSSSTETYNYFPTDMYESRNYSNSQKNEKQNEYIKFGIDNMIDKKSYRFRFTGAYNYTNANIKLNDYSLSMMNNETLSQTQIMDLQKNYISDLSTEMRFSFTLKNLNPSVTGGYKLYKENQHGSKIDTAKQSSRQIQLKQDGDLEKSSQFIGISFLTKINKFSRITYGGEYSFNKESNNRIATDLILNCKDTANTRNYDISYENTSGFIRFFYMGKNFDLTIDGKLENIHRKHIEEFPTHYQSDEDYLIVTSYIGSSYKFSPVSKINFKYRLASKLPSVEESRSAINDINPLSLQVGNPNLKLPQSHNLNLNFNKTFVSKSSALEVQLEYRITKNQITKNNQYFTEKTYLKKYNYTVMRGATLYSVENFGTLHNFSSYAKYSTLSELLKAKLGFKLEYRYTDRPTLSQSMRNNFKQNFGSFTFNYISNFSRKMELSIENTLSIDRNKSTQSEANDILNENVSFNVRTTIIPKYTLNTWIGYMYRRRCSDGDEKITRNVNASITRSFGKRATLNIDGYNLLDTQNSSMLEKTAEYMHHKEMIFKGRYFMASFTYKF